MATPGKGAAIMNTRSLLHHRLRSRMVVAATILTLTLAGSAIAGTLQAAPAAAARTTPPAAGSYLPVTQVRLLDTRASAPVAAGATRTLKVTGQGGIPSSGVGTVALTVVALDHAGAGYLTVYADGTTRPSVPSVTFSAGYARDNEVLAQPGSDGGITVYNGSTAATNVVVDASGYFTGGQSPSPAAIGRWHRLG